MYAAWKHLSRCAVGAATFAMSFSLAAAQPQTQPQTPYLFGAFPMMAVAEAEKVFSPIAENFTQALARPVRFRTKASFDQYADELAKQTYDIALVQPFDYVDAHDKHGYLPLARRGEPLVAHIMVLPKSAVQKLEDLKGKRVGLPPATAAVSHLAKMSFLQIGLHPAKDVALQYYKSHDSCLQQLLIGDIEACVSAPYPVKFFSSKWGVEFRLLAKSPPIPHALLVVHSRVPKAERERLLQTVLGWPETEAGRKLLEFGQLTPFVPATNAEYDAVRKYLKSAGQGYAAQTLP